MKPDHDGPIRVGDWRVERDALRMTRDGDTLRVDVRSMRLLSHLVERRGEVVSVEELLDAVWPDVTVSPDSVYQAVASLRRMLGDDPKAPAYIATAPRQGYRLVAEVAPWTAHPTKSPRRLARRVWLAGLVVGLLVVAGGLVVWRGASGEKPPPVSIAVMPFLDLTDAMDQEPFTDGITEELTDQLSRSPMLKVAAPRTTAIYKTRKAAPGDVARALGVAYVLDGSVRKSGDRVRVSARLLRGDSGFVVWSESYDRPATDMLWVQEDIAGAVAKALAQRGAPAS